MQWQHCWLTVKPISVLSAKKTGASLTTVRSALTVAEKTGKIKKTQNIHGYSKTNQTNTDKVEVGEGLNETNPELNPNNLRFEDLSDDVKSRLIHQYTQENQVLYKNNGNKPELTNIGNIEEEINSGTGGIIPKNTDNQEQFTRMMWLQSEPIIRKVVFNPKTLLVYDYVKAKFNYQGDIASFLNESVEFFCKQKGIDISINLTEKVQSW